MKKISKKLLTITISSFMLLTPIFSYAATKTAHTVDFSLKLNNRDVKLENAEIITINGSTYLPLAALCRQLFGMSVDWNNETQTIEMWNITKPSDKGSHEFPVALGKPVSGEFYNKSDKKYIPYSITVTEVTRGSSVDTWLKDEYMKLNEYPVKEVLVREKNESPSKFKKRVEKAEETYKKAVEKYEEKFDDYLKDLKQDDSKHLLRAKIRVDIMQANSEFCYNTSLKDLTPYCGNANVNGLIRQFVQYDVKQPKIRAEINYSDREILTNGTYEGYYVVPVYISDSTPRVMYKDGQYLALYYQ